MSVVFNLVWLKRTPPRDGKLQVALREGNPKVLREEIDAVILFPSLMTPVVYHRKSAEPWIELLVATKETLTAAHVNHQLKVNGGLESEKRSHPETLFVGVGNNILVESADKDGDGIVRTHKMFEGVLHALFEKCLTDAGFSKLFRVRVRIEALESAQEAFAHLRPDDKKEDLQWRAETHDELIKAMLERRHVVDGYKQIPEKGLFSFKIDPQNGPQPWLDRANPIVAHHPVYVFETSEPEHLNFGHLTDFHLNNRLEILKKASIRVIEGAAAEAVSLPIGKLMQPTNKSFTELLNRMANDGQAHALLIGGDLIDHQLNAYTTAKVSGKMEEVWNAVDVSEKGQARGYAPAVDMVGFYSLLMRFCRSKAKPVFGIAGNHDAYFKPFGISPRFLGTRANAGIPADINLTLYEAVLAFGPSYADFTMHLVPNEPPSSFQAEWMEWFYSVFTPFGEASIQLPKQRVVCLGWGNNEDMMGGGQGTLGHLPRADESVSAVQLKLLQNATKEHSSHRVIVISHFTVASFEEPVPMRTGGAATVGALHTAGEEDKFNMGTFEKRHDTFLELLKERTITCILTGHSHRRGLYFLGDAKVDMKAGAASFPVTIHDPQVFKVAEQKQAHRMPAIVVSDSAGPYPRYNWRGEFDGWGSDVPGGAVVTFADDGSLSGVKVVPSGASLPRLAVALDYADVEKKIVWEKPIQTKPFSLRDEATMLRSSVGGPFYELEVPLGKAMTKIGLSVANIEFHASGDVEKAAVLTIPVAGRRVCLLSRSQSRALYDWMHQKKATDLFLAITFTWDWDPHVMSKYEKAGAWIYEVVAPVPLPVVTAVTPYASAPLNYTTVPLEADNGPVYYSLSRPMRQAGENSVFWYADLPDFDRRRKQAGQPSAPAK